MFIQFDYFSDVQKHERFLDNDTNIKAHGLTQNVRRKTNDTDMMDWLDGCCFFIMLMGWMSYLIFIPQICDA